MGEPCWICGFRGTDLDLHIGQCGDLIREGAAGEHPFFSGWSLDQLVNHRLHLQSQLEA